MLTKPKPQWLAGHFLHRMRDDRGDDEQVRRECAFAEEWHRENNPHSSLPDTLMANLPDYELPLSLRELRLVATMMQWLGSHVGFSYLTRALERCGYRLEKIS